MTNAANTVGMPCLGVWADPRATFEYRPSVELLTVGDIKPVIEGLVTKQVNETFGYDLTRDEVSSTSYPDVGMETDLLALEKITIIVQPKAAARERLGALPSMTEISASKKKLQRQLDAVSGTARHLHRELKEKEATAEHRDLHAWLLEIKKLLDAETQARKELELKHEALKLKHEASERERKASEAKSRLDIEAVKRRLGDSEERAKRIEKRFAPIILRTLLDHARDKIIQCFENEASTWEELVERFGGSLVNSILEKLKEEKYVKYGLSQEARGGANPSQMSIPPFRSQEAATFDIVPRQCLDDHQYFELSTDLDFTNLWNIRIVQCGFDHRNPSSIPKDDYVKLFVEARRLFLEGFRPLQVNGGWDLALPRPPSAPPVAALPEEPQTPAPPAPLKPSKPPPLPQWKKCKPNPNCRIRIWLMMSWDRRRWSWSLEGTVKSDLSDESIIGEPAPVPRAPKTPRAASQAVAMQSAGQVTNPVPSVQAMLPPPRPPRSPDRLPTKRPAATAGLPKRPTLPPAKPMFAQAAAKSMTPQAPASSRTAALRKSCIRQGTKATKVVLRFAPDTPDAPTASKLTRLLTDYTPAPSLIEITLRGDFVLSFDRVLYTTDHRKLIEQIANAGYTGAQVLNRGTTSLLKFPLVPTHLPGGSIVTFQWLYNTITQHPKWRDVRFVQRPRFVTPAGRVKQPGLSATVFMEISDEIFKHR
ncbi:hypothetical protein F5887DRAFT_1073856 [Amanita rubescens]|nr:hypothetical protein F5887DRAFT_1073856 [Amanita rubescens]